VTTDVTHYDVYPARQLKILQRSKEDIKALQPNLNYILTAVKKESKSRLPGAGKGIAE
jgi:hypothetical protein